MPTCDTMTLRALSEMGFDSNLPGESISLAAERRMAQVDEGLTEITQGAGSPAHLCATHPGAWKATNLRNESDAPGFLELRRLAKKVLTAAIRIPHARTHSLVLGSLRILLFPAMPARCRAMRPDSHARPVARVPGPGPSRTVLTESHACQPRELVVLGVV